jgi:hypothetical protein
VTDKGAKKDEAVENTDASKDAKKPDPDHFEDALAVTNHSITVGGDTLEYTATAGRIVLKEDDNTKKASFFFTAYTKDGVDDPTVRPIVFAFTLKLSASPGGNGLPLKHRARLNATFSDSLSDQASVIVVGAVDVLVASLQDAITSKRAAGRPKDVVALPLLEAHLASRDCDDEPNWYMRSGSFAEVSRNGVSTVPPGGAASHRGVRRGGSRSRPRRAVCVRRWTYPLAPSP